MSDAELRSLERRFRETGAVADEAAWLRARVRAGELTEERLDLAACLGHPAAATAAGRAPGAPTLVGSASEMSERAFLFSMKQGDPWLEQVRGAGLELVQRICLALGYRVLPEWLRLRPKDAWAPGLLAASDAWVEAPSTPRRERLLAFRATSPAREEHCTPRPSALAPDFPIDTLADKVCWSYKRVFADPEYGAYYALTGVQNLVEVADEAPAESLGCQLYLCAALNGTQFAGGAAAVQQALAVEVVPWVLGTGDLLAERRAAQRPSLQDPANLRLGGQPG